MVWTPTCISCEPTTANPSLEQENLDNLQAETVLRALVTAASPKATTFIPPDVTILDTALDDGVLTIDLSNEFSDVSGAPRTQAVAQLVHRHPTAPIDRVWFSVEGEHIPAPDADGVDVEGPVDRSDYSSLLPAPADGRG